MVDMAVVDVAWCISEEEERRRNDAIVGMDDVWRTDGYAFMTRHIRACC